jgi:hypothetical protein
MKKGRLQDWRCVMLTYEDCVGLTDLEEEEIEAIAQHEHVPEIVAAELGCCLIHQLGGESSIKKIILEDVEEASRHDHPQEAAHWREVFDHFCMTHPLPMRQAA